MRIIVENAVARFPEFRFKEPLFWEMAEGENWAVVGPNGAGKSLFTDTLHGGVALKDGSVKCLDESGCELPSYKIKTLVFKDIYSMTGAQGMYYQQRWNSQDAEESPVASSLFAGFSAELIDEYSDLFGIHDLLEKRVVSLSSGELRKFLITRALMSEPSLLILDNPFIGLDEKSRGLLDAMLGELREKKGLQVILVLSQTKDIPLWVDKIQPVRDMTLLPAVTRSEFFATDSLSRGLFSVCKTPAFAHQASPEGSSVCKTPAFAHQASPEGGLEAEIPAVKCSGATFENAIIMNKVNVRLGGRRILADVDWTVERGSNWALLGANGSGKSTLLSLVCGDNPQAYANDITLFDRRRGTGESIWDIKKRIGYLSPDIHTYYLVDIPCLKVVASGFFDSVGLFRECSEEQYDTALQWMEIFGIAHLAQRSFVKISYGEQRAVLLARAFVKSPELLILDEPFHGLDAGKKELALSIVERYCQSPEVTLIYVTHYADEIPSCITATKTLSMTDGNTQIKATEVAGAQEKVTRVSVEKTVQEAAERIRRRKFILEKLDEWGISYFMHEHPPIPTIEEALEYWKNFEGCTHCKNLFFRNHKGNRHYLVILECHKQMDIHALEHELHQGKLTFASPERMAKCLDTTPGSVSLLGLANDPTHQVKLFLDKDLRQSKKVTFHPNDNTASLEISTKDMYRFLDLWGGEWEEI